MKEAFLGSPLDPRYTQGHVGPEARRCGAAVTRMVGWGVPHVAAYSVGMGVRLQSSADVGHVAQQMVEAGSFGGRLTGEYPEPCVGMCGCRVRAPLAVLVLMPRGEVCACRLRDSCLHTLPRRCNDATPAGGLY